MVLEISLENLLQKPKNINENLVAPSLVIALIEIIKHPDELQTLFRKNYNKVEFSIIKSTVSAD